MVGEQSRVDWTAQVLRMRVIITGIGRIARERVERVMMCEVGFPSVGPIALTARAQELSSSRPPQQQRPCITPTMSHEQNGAPAPKTEADFAEVGELLRLPHTSS